MDLPFTQAERATLNDQLSKRFINLDPGGYFIIYVDSENALIVAKHYTNIISEQGLALDPATGLPIPTRGKNVREPSHVFQGRTAKELCIEIFEKADSCLVTCLDHGAYLGRELQRAEHCLDLGLPYVQD